MTANISLQDIRSRRWRLVRAQVACAAVALQVACGGGGATAEPASATVDTSTKVAVANDLAEPDSKDIAMRLISSAENSTTKWKEQYIYIEDIGDGRGYTGGIIGFTSGTGDMLEVVRVYTAKAPGNPLEAFLPALQAVKGTDSHDGLGDPFVTAWKAAAESGEFKGAQNSECDRVYFDPAVALAKSDGLRDLGQFIYFDAAVVHGRGNGAYTLDGIRATALAKATPPSQGGDEAAYLNAFLDARVIAMKSEPAHEDVSRIETAQRVFLQEGNLDLRPPLHWKVYDKSFSIPEAAE